MIQIKYICYLVNLKSVFFLIFMIEKNTSNVNFLTLSLQLISSKTCYQNKMTHILIQINKHVDCDLIRPSYLAYL
jgi:hypothetical protein